ncbi:vitellogenin-2-like [Phasianus colchicus]|uniref:vitellogenin-2-like n=1 Tax=Phasianus colchicus TaxID=9054 RepID=UPI00129DA5D7|nr:vitellogenin-2-like [Phasianus colchicus]
MRGLILALVLALVGAQKHNLVPGFRTSKTYLYDYEGLILHGLPGKGLAAAGLKLICRLEISRVSRSDHLLQIRSPKLEEYHGFWPRDPFTLSPKLTGTIAACFSQAFKFEYTEGRVGSIYSPENCPIFCTNLVRGILNMMQITIRKSQNVYELQESGIEGTCQTRYVIQDDSKNNRATISKSKDLTDCQDSVVQSTGMAYIRPCPTCPMKVRNMKGTVLFTYKMKYYDSGALMTSAMSEQMYQISPFNEPDGIAAVEARQELVLVDIKSIPIKAPNAQLQNQGSLRYHFPEGLLQMPIPLIRVKNADVQLIETLQQLVQNNEEGSTTEASVKFLQMVQLLRVVTVDQIESVWVQLASEPPYRHWFMSAVCAAGATDTFQFLKQKIHDKNLNIWEAAVALPLAFHSVMPNKKTLEVASTFLTCPQILKAPMLRVLVYLGYGSLVNKYCAQPSFCPNELLQPLHDLAAEASSRSHVEDMVLALKAIGNAGEPASIKQIQKFLPTFSLAAAELPSRIHADAVLALRKIARKDPAKVREITLQIFMDNTLAPNVRMMACIVLFEAKPSLPVVAAMANSLLTETSLQVASFTYSHMKALAVGGIPQLYNLSAACNIAIKLLGSRLDESSYRYSKIIHAGGYSYVYKAGAIWRVYLMNSPNTMFPSDIITKVRGYYANTATDIVEVALRSQSLTDIIRKQNIPFAQYDTYKTLKELGKTLQGWKELPPEDPLLSAYIKVLGQEIAFIDIDNSIIQQAMKSLTGSSSWQPAVKRAVEEVQRGVSGRWTLPAVVAELRHAVPTVLGLPLELSMCGAALAQAAAAVDIQMSPPLSNNFRPSQLLETNMDIHADIKPKVYFHMIAMMGTNTQYLQSGLELHAEFSANTTMKFDARINMKEKNVKIETLPCHQEVELAAVRSEAYAISRNMEEVDSEKKSPILPKGEMPTVANQHFQSSEIFSRARSWEQRNIHSVISKGHLQGSEEEHHHGEGQRSYAHVFCRKLASLGCSACLSLKSRNSAFLRNTFLNKLVGELEAKIVLKPVHTDADTEKIQLEIQAGAKAASKIIDATSSGPKEEKEPSLYENIKAKLKKILGIENVFKVANKTRHHKKWIHSKVKAAVTDLWEEPSATPLSSSSSTDSSAEGKEPRNKHEKDEMWQFGKKHGSGSSSSTGSGSSKTCSSSREDSSGDKLCNVDSEYFNQQADLPIYQFWFKPADEQDPQRNVRNSSISSSSSSSSNEGISIPVSQPMFLGDSKSPVLAAVLRAIKRNEQSTGYQLVLYTDRQASRLRVQVFVSSITESNRWKLCGDASVVNSHKASGTLKWGKDCQDYKVATQIATGQFAAHPAIQVKVEWSKVPSSVRKTARWFYTYFPGAAYMLGYSQKRQRGPSHQAAMVMALTSPRTCDVVLKLPELTVYKRAIRLPLPLPSSSDIPTTTLPSSVWNTFSQAAFSIIENLKARCSVSQNMITTFNGVEFNYSMPANCYHILTQDCSPELKFLVMIKRLEESTDLTAINVRLASHEVDMYVSSGQIQLKINGVQTPTDVPYKSKSGLLISSEKEGLSLKAPEYGVEKLYYDGHKLEIQVAFWMVGKTCGICGKYDAEKKREYQMPSGYLAEDAVSFAQSWVISEDTCTGACKLQRKFVKIEKPVAFDKKASKCFSIEPVLRCAEGCSATRTVPVSVGFHCVPSDSTLELEERQVRLDQKSEDLVSRVDAHTACACAQQPCSA